MARKSHVKKFGEDFDFKKLNYYSRKGKGVSHFFVAPPDAPICFLRYL